MGCCEPFLLQGRREEQMIGEYNIHRVIPELLLDIGDLGCFCQLVKFLGCGDFGTKPGHVGMLCVCFG